jgi:hypothetical protein
MVPPWGLWQFAAPNDGFVMRRVIVIALAGASLAGCSSVSFDSFKPAPSSVQVQLESVPPGADAHTSLGPSCKTPCSVTLAPPEGGFSVTYAMAKFQPATVQVQVTPGDFLNLSAPTISPSPVLAELQPEPAPAKPLRKMPKPKKPAAPPSAAAAPEPAR